MIRASVFAKVEMLIVAKPSVADANTVHVDIGDVVDIVLDVVVVCAVAPAYKEVRTIYKWLAGLITTYIHLASTCRCQCWHIGASPAGLHVEPTERSSRYRPGLGSRQRHECLPQQCRSFRSPNRIIWDAPVDIDVQGSSGGNGLWDSVNKNLGNGCSQRGR